MCDYAMHLAAFALSFIVVADGAWPFCSTLFAASLCSRWRLASSACVWLEGSPQRPRPRPTLLYALLLCVACRVVSRAVYNVTDCHCDEPSVTVLEPPNEHVFVSKPTHAHGHAACATVH